MSPSRLYGLFVAAALVTTSSLAQPSTLQPATPAAITTAAAAPALSTIDDGPHVFFQAGKPGVSVSWVCKGEVIKKTYARDIGAVIAPACAYPKTITIREDKTTFPVQAKFTAKKLVVLSDVHGQFDVMVQLLQANKIIDQELKWTFADAHVVMIGDMFDRGPRVTEVLWLLYQLEAEAQTAGGAFHVMLGNHEAMVLYDDLRYINPKYAEAAKLLNETYPGLYSEHTVLGRWLRRKPMLLQVNDMLFVHGGLNPEYAALKLTIQETNEAFRKSLGLARDTFKSTPLPAFLYSSRGPIWYRGYFREPLIDSTALDSLLAQYAVKRMVVGHTTFRGVFSHFGGRIINTDTDIQKGKSGELVFWQNGVFTRGSFTGEQTPLQEFVKETVTSPPAK